MTFDVLMFRQIYSVLPPLPAIGRGDLFILHTQSFFTRVYISASDYRKYLVNQLKVDYPVHQGLKNGRRQTVGTGTID
jgi:hypothetical protein